MNKCSSIKNPSTSNRKIITFIGMMGTGKSKFGRLVAGHLSYNFYDIDTLIEKDQKNTIKNIFSKKGETFFRKIEKDKIKNLVTDIIEKEEKAIRLYSIIYKAIEEIKEAMEGMLSPEFKEQIVGTAEIRETFKITKFGTIAGCYVTDGRINRNHQVRIIREGIVIDR